VHITVQRLLLTTVRALLFSFPLLFHMQGRVYFCVVFRIKYKFFWNNTWVFQGHYKEQVIDSNTNPSFTVELVQEGSWYRSETLNFNSSAPSLSTKIQREWSTCCIQEEWPLLLKRHILLLPAITPTSRIATLLPLLCTSNSEVYTVVIGPAQTEHFLTVLVNSVSW
jgi:hypothetical protein